MSRLAYVLAVVLFVLAVLVEAFGDVSRIELVAAGLAAFALGHLLPD